MRKRILHIALAMFLTIGLQAQVVVPVGTGIDLTPVKITAHERGVAAVSITSDSEVVVDLYNGDFWYRLIDPPLPKAGANAYGVLEVKDLKSFNGKLYLVAEHSLDIAEVTPNYVLEWNGSQWTAIESDLLDNALLIKELVSMNGDLQLIGKFSENNQYYNVLNLVNGNWQIKGNLITKNIVTDDFVSVVNLNNKTYATGSFTNPGIGTVTMVEWNGSVWQNTSFPAFLTRNNKVGSYNDQLVVYGNNSFNTEKIKLQNGTAWQNISAGLDNVTINALHSFCEADNVLYAFGDFEEDTSNFSIMSYKNSEWQAVAMNVSGISDAVNGNGALYVTGSFDDGARLRNVGRMNASSGLLHVKLYNDVNGNCVKDTEEDWMRNYPMHINNEVEYLLSDRDGQLYLELPLEDYSLNATEVLYYQATCPDLNLSIDEIKQYDGYAFGVRKKANVSDAVVWITDNQSYNYHNGQSKRAMICAANNGSTDILGATIDLTHNNDVSNFTSELPYTSYNNGTATWTVDIPENDKLCFYVDYRISGATDEVVLETEIDLGQTVDANTTDNRSTLMYKTGDTEANKKYCDNGTVIKETESELNYKISFKNQGGKEAVDVKIVDEIDEDVVIGYKGVEYLHSHACTSLPTTYTILPNGKWQYKFIWEFNDINLSSIADESSEGFLDLKIYVHPSTLEHGMDICNQASIFYSYKKGTFNEPLLTNTVCSKVDRNGSTGPSAIIGLSVNPVPANSKFTVYNKLGQAFALSLGNALGQTIITTDVQAYGERSIDVSELPAGVYMLYADGQFVQKVVVQ